MQPTLSQRIDKALACRAQGYNCAQCIVLAFDDIARDDLDAAVRMTSCLGLGYGDMSQICGAVSGADTVLGLRHFTGPADKPAMYQRSRAIMEQFRAENGALACHELKSMGRPCPQLIASAITLLHNRLTPDE